MGMYKTKSEEIGTEHGIVTQGAAEIKLKSLQRNRWSPTGTKEVYRH